jgi:ribosomal protein S18 acetylase RimI-like enzyme
VAIVFSLLGVRMTATTIAVVSSEVVILPATAADAGELLTLQRAAYVTEGQLHQTPFLPPLTETLGEMLDAVTSKPVFKAMSGSRVVGAIRMTVRSAVGEIGRIAVAPDQQGRGIGTQLILHAERLAPVHVTRFELFTGPNSAANIALYERLGYVRYEPPTRSHDDPLVYLAKARFPQ